MDQVFNPRKAGDKQKNKNNDKETPFKNINIRNYITSSKYITRNGVQYSGPMFKNHTNQQKKNENG